MQNESLKSVFQFKNFSIEQDLCAMKIGTDGVLLGAIAIQATFGISSHFNCLDIGTGTGILSLMIAQKFPQCYIDAIDIDLHSYEQAMINFSRVKFQPNSINQIQPFHCSFEEWIQICKINYDVIISNPPFYSNQFPVENKKRNLARVANNLSQEEILFGVKKMLNAYGKCFLIYPIEDAERCIKLCEKFHLFCNKKTIVYSKKDKPPIRMVLELSKESTRLIESELYIEDGSINNFTNAYTELTKDFYLHF